MQKKIIRKGKDNEGGDYPQDVSKLLFDLESEHFWFRGRNEIIFSLIKKVISRPESMSFLEVGCGTGYVLSFLEQKGFKVEGNDISSESLKLARLRTRAKLIRGDFRKLSFSKEYQVIGLFDVIEHINDDKSFLKRVALLLKQKGYVVITVPALMSLWSAVDRISGHKRRYNKKQLIDLCKQSGFDIKVASYYNFFLFLPQLLLRKMAKDKKNNQGTLSEGGLRKLPYVINFIFRMLMLIESKIIRYMPLPLGTSLIIVGRKVK